MSYGDDKLIGEIKAFINDVVLDNQGQDLTDTTRLIELGILDSFAVLSLLTFLRERYQISVDFAEIRPEHLETIQSISKFVKDTQSGK